MMTRTRDKAGSHGHGQRLAGLPNGDPLLATRLRPPVLPREFLRRARLLRRLDEAVRLPVTVVNGPAGAGKTLLVAHWLGCGRLPGPAAWLTLEASDNQPGNFWAYVREALCGSLSAMPVELGVPAQAEHVESSLLVRLAAWINEQHEPALLVLDEFEHIDDPGLVRQLHDLVRHTAGQLRLVLISRTEPPLPLHRYRAAGELAEIRAADLALNCPETGALLERHGLRPSASTVAAVHRALSGWTAGTRLLALAAQDAEDADAYLKRIDAEHAALSDFLLAEVLNTQPPATQDLLLRCSILSRIHPGLADALTGRRDGQRILSGLHQANAFTEDLSHGWYRLHPMFAGILRLHLKAVAPDSYEELHSRAAHWLADHGCYQEAVEHAADAGAWSFAAQVLVDELAAGELLAGRDTSRLRGLFARMPASVHTPAAELVRAVVLLGDGDGETALRLLRRAEEQLPSQDVPVQLTAALVQAGAGRLLGSDDVADSAARTAHELEPKAPPGPLGQHPELISLVDADLGSALLWHGRLDEASEALDAAAQAPPAPSTARLRHDAQCRLALIDYLRGWPGRAERRVRQADEEADRSSLPPGSRTQVGVLVLAATALERDEVKAAQAVLNRLTQSGSGHDDPAVALGGAVIRAKLHLALGRPEAALTVLEETRRHDLVDRSSEWADERLAVTESAVHLAAGRPQAAAAELERVPTRAPDSVVTAAQVRLAANQDAEDSVHQLQALQSNPAVGSATRTRALLLLAQADEGLDEANSERLLERALATARAERLRRPFRESARWVRHQLRLHPRLGQVHSWLPDDLLPPAPHSRESGGDTPPLEPLTTRECAVLVRAGRMMSTEEIAEDLFVSANTVKTHLKSVNRKLGTASRRDAVRRARRLRLLDES